MRKFYIHDKEINIVIQTDTEGKIRWCRSPVAPKSNYPSCNKTFYTCEYEEAEGCIKHIPGSHKYIRPKVETMVSCWDLPLEYCQKLIDADDMYCPHCNRKIEYKRGVNNG